MSTATAPPATPEVAAGTLPCDWSSDWSLADLQQRLGGIPAERIRLVPAPGYATEQDLLDIADHEDRWYEFEDGVLVEKAMGWQEAVLAAWIITELGAYLKTHQAGVSLVWYIDPTTRSARAFTSPTDETEFDEHGVLDGGRTLPGFQLSLRELFERADQQGPSPQE
jgi:Uma2 family endonuclease